MDEWDALHAMCLYQILELFCISEELSEKPKLTAAQLHIPFLLKVVQSSNSTLLSFYPHSVDC